MNFLEKITACYNELVNIGVIESTKKTKYQIKIPKRKKHEDIKWILGIYVFIFGYILFICQIARYNESYYTIPKFITSVIIMILLITAIVFKIKKDDEENIFIKFKRKFIADDIYQNDLPSKLRPAHVRMLLNDFEIDEISIVSTLVDLMERGYIYIVKNDKEIFFRKSSKKDEKLLEYEKFLIKWLIDKYGNEHEVTSTQITKNLTNNMCIERPYQLFNFFQYCVWTSFPLDKYYNNWKNTNKIKYIILIVISIFFIKYMWSIPLIIYGLISLTILHPVMRLNNDGLEEKENWNDFKRYLTEILDITNKSIKTINKNDIYLAYSVALDVDSVLVNEIKYIFEGDVYNNFLEDDKDLDRELSLDSTEKTILEPLDISKSVEELILVESEKYNL